MTTQVNHPAAYPDHPRPAVGAVVFKDGKVLLVKRGGPPAAGQWAIPGGGVHLGETLQQAAEREVHEETSIVIEAQAPVYTFDVVDRDAEGRVRFHYVIVDLAARYISGEPTPGDDAADAAWVSADALAQLPVNIRTRTLLHRVFDFGAAPGESKP